MKEKNKIQFFRILRIVLYALLLLVFLLLSPEQLENAPVICLFRNCFHLPCPSCGATRALVYMLHFQWQEAFSLNPLFTACLYPIAFLFCLQDLYTILVPFLMKKKHSLSMIEYLLWGKRQW